MAKKIIILIGAILFSIGVYALFFPSQKIPTSSTQLQQNKLPVSPDVSAYFFDGSSSYYFSNGRYIVQYNVQSEATERLSLTTFLPPIVDVRVTKSGRYIVFQTLDQIESQVLSDMLGEGADKTIPAWFVLDKNNKDFRLLGQNIEDLRVDNETVYYSQGGSVYKESLVGVEDAENIYSGAVSSFIYVANNNLLVHEIDSVYLVSLEDGGTELLADELSRVEFSGSNECFISSQKNENDKAETIYINYCGEVGFSKKLGEVNEEYAGFTTSGEAVLGENNFLLFFNAAHEPKSKTELGLEGLQNFRINKVTSPGFILGVGNNNNYSMATSSLLAIKELVSKEKTSLGEGFSYRVNERGEIIIFGNGFFTNSTKKQAEQLVKKQGVNTSLYKIFYEPVFD